MNLTCDMVQDLLPLYKDGLASEDSAKAIREHLRSCKSCRDLHRKTVVSDMKQRVCRKKHSCPPPPFPEDVELHRFRKISERLRRRHLIRSALMVVVISASLLTILFSFLKKGKD